MRVVWFVLVFGVILPFGAQGAGKVFRCTDARGAVTYSNTMCPVVSSSPQAAPAPEQIQEIPPPPSARTMADVDRACQVQTQAIALRYAKELDAIDAEVYTIAREGQAGTDEGKARLEKLDTQRWSIDRRSRDERGVVADQCEKDRRTLRSSLPTGR